MNILIVEDELLIAEMLKEMLEELGNNILGIAKNYNQAVVLLDKHAQIDLCFLDINLQAAQTGFDIAQTINNTYKTPVLFLTSYSDKTTIANAMTFNPEAYLIKPFSETDLFATLEIIKSRKKLKTEHQSIVIKDGAQTIKINVADVQYLKSDNVYVKLITNSKTYLVRKSLSKFLEDIAIDCIVRVHRTFAVNINVVKAISGENLIVGEEKIPLSRMNREEFVAKFNG